MPSCVAYGCSNRVTDKTKRQKIDEKTQRITFHRFPKCPEKRKAWIQAVKRDKWTPSPRSVLCSVHFEEKFFDRTSLVYVRLRENAVPTIFNSSYIQKETRKQLKERLSIEEPTVMPSTSTEKDPLDITDFEMENNQMNISAENSIRDKSISPRRFHSPTKELLHKKIEQEGARYRQKLRVLQNAKLRYKKKIASIQNDISALRKLHCFRRNFYTSFLEENKYI